MRLKAKLAILCLLLGLLWFNPISAQSPDEVNEIAKDLYCPLCQGVTLADCPLKVCEQMRDLIKRKLAEGKSREEIIQYFVAQYGEQVLAAPPKKGFNLIVWVLPLVALGLGGGLVLLVLRGWVGSRKGREEAVSSELGEGVRREYLERLDRELEQLG